MEIIGVKDPSLELNLKQLLLYFDKVYVTNLEDVYLKFKYDCIPEYQEIIENQLRDIEFLESKGYLKLIDNSVFDIILKNKHLDKRILNNKDFQQTINLYNNLHDSFEEKGKHLRERNLYQPNDYTFN